jgi:hypothetical protein
LRLDTPTLFAHTIAITLLRISTRYKSEKEEDGKDDIEDIDPGDKLVNYFNNGNNYNHDNLVQT